MIFSNIFKREIKQSRTTILNTKMGPAHWTPDDYKNFIEETYLKNRICFRCMFMIAQAVSTVEWGLFRRLPGKLTEYIENHEILDLIKRPNPKESFNYILFKVIVYLLGSGNSFIERIKLDREKYPREIYTLRPDKIQIKTDEISGEISEYLYDQTIPFKIDRITKDSDILQMKLANPLDDFWGASPIKALMREIDTSNEAIEWQKKVLENEGRPGLVFSVDGTLSDKQYDRLEKLLEDKYSGATGAGKNLVVEGGAKVIPYNWTPKELDFVESHRELARGIATGWGVPPQMLGIIGDSTYCLPAYSKIATNKGLKNISSIIPGDYVYSLVKDKIEIKKVLKQEKTGHKLIYEIKAENNILRATGNHPVLIRKEKDGRYSLEYIRVDQLNIGDILIEMHTFPYEELRANSIGYIIPIEYLNFSEIKHIEELWDEDVYDIEVEESHNFIADGILVHNSNFETARQIFWEDTIMGYLNIVKTELNNWFFGSSDNSLYLDYDLEKIPALSLKRDKKWERVQKSDFLLINEKRRMLGLPEIEGGNVILMPLNYTVLQPGTSPGEPLTPVLGRTQVADIEDDGMLNNIKPDGSVIDTDEEEENNDE